MNDFVFFLLLLGATDSVGNPRDVVKIKAPLEYFSPLSKMEDIIGNY